VNRLKTAVLIDAWFPFVGGGQIHVKELTQAFRLNHQVNSKLFYPPHPHLLVRLVWSLLVPFQIAFHHLFITRFHLIHSHGYNSGLAAKITSLLLKIPVVHTVHGSNLIDKNIKSLKSRLEAWLLTGITYDAQITVSSNFLQHKNTNSNVKVIPNGVDVDLFDQENTKKSTKPTIIWIGRDDPIKDLPTFMQAIKIVEKKIPHIATTVVLNGKLNRQQIAKKFKSAHVYVSSSLSEGQPITLLEAWAAKLPVVVTKVGDNPKMIKDGVNGHLINPSDPEALANKIINLLQHPREAKSMGQAGYELVKEKFTWDHIAAQTFKLYQSVLENKFLIPPN